MRRFCRGKHFWLVTILFLLGLFCVRNLFRYYFFFTHDGDHHLARAFDAIIALKEGHFPLRWAGSLNYYCGVAVFNFFYPLFYYLIFLVNFFTHDIALALKMIYSLTLIASPIFFYWWLWEETENRGASFLGGLLYLFAPYRFVLVFVRSSPEFLSYTLLPLLLLLLRKFISSLKLKPREQWRRSFWLVLAGGFFVASHNFTVMVVLPLVFLWGLFSLWRHKLFNRNNFFRLGLIFLSFVGLASFFLGPMVLEQSFVRLKTVQTIDYHHHFPTLGQLLRSPWGFHYSAAGLKDDGMSFMLGYAQWLVLGLTTFFLFIKRKQMVKHLEVLFWWLVAVGSVFLILPYSLPIWEKVVLLQKIQFSWRLLGVAIFAIAALAGFWLARLRGRWKGLLLVSLALIAIWGNRHHLLVQPANKIDWYFRFEELHPNRFNTTTFDDDILGSESPAACFFGEPFFVSGEGVGDLAPDELRERLGYRQQEKPTPFAYQESTGVDLTTELEFAYRVERGSTYGRVVFDWPTQSKSDLRLNLEFYPGGYQFLLNGQLIDDDNCSGRVCFSRADLRSGENELSWRIVQTPLQRLFNGISLSFLSAWIILFVWRGRNVKIKKR